MLKIKRAYNLLRLKTQYIEVLEHRTDNRKPAIAVKDMAKTQKAVEKRQVDILIESKTEKPAVFREVYAIKEPYVYAAIVKNPKTQKIMYKIIEPTLKKNEKERLAEVKKFLVEEVDVNLKEIETREKAENYLKEKTREIIKKYRMRVSLQSIDKLVYYVLRDFTGYGKIDPLMNDHLVEDISADGVNIPIYVWHRMYESLPTNIAFEEEEELDSFIIRLAYLARKNISIAKPILDASLPDGSRIQLTYGREVTRRGSTFTIRRFRIDPFTISDLIALNTVSSEIASYLWYIIENRASVVVAGGVAAGKTTMLNCLSMFIKPEMKIVSVEDTPELNLPHENWIPSVVRLGFGHEDAKTGSITLFDLLKAAVRQRPDFIIVGEVRGEEAYTLFQAMATGHLGMSTLHAESVEAVINRLESEPMNIPRSLLAMIDVIIVMERTEIKEKPARRATTTTEILELNQKTRDIPTVEVFRWNSKKDRYVFSGHSDILKKHQIKRGITEKEIKHELNRRKIVLEWMVHERIRHYTDVANVIREYHANPRRTYQKARVGLK